MPGITKTTANKITNPLLNNKTRGGANSQNRGKKTVTRIVTIVIRIKNPVQCCLENSWTGCDDIPVDNNPIIYAKQRIIPPILNIT